MTCAPTSSRNTLGRDRREYCRVCPLVTARCAVVALCALSAHTWSGGYLPGDSVNSSSPSHATATSDSLTVDLSRPREVYKLVHTQPLAGYIDLYLPARLPEWFKGCGSSSHIERFTGSNPVPGSVCVLAFCRSPRLSIGNRSGWGYALSTQSLCVHRDRTAWGAGDTAARGRTGPHRVAPGRTGPHRLVS